MATLVIVRLKIYDCDGQLMPGFPLIRGPKDGQMAAEAYSDQYAEFEFLASPDREIEIKLLSPDDGFNEIFYCRSSDRLSRFNVRLKYPRQSYLAKTNIIWRSQHSQINIPQTQFQMKQQSGSGILTAENGEKQIQSIIGEAVQLTYIFPDGIKRSKTIVYMARRINANPLIISVDNLITPTETASNTPTTPKQVQPEQLDCSAKFHKISKIILQHEGGYVNDPNDSGGATNKGIAWNTWLKFAQQDLGVTPTLEHLKSITDEQAEIIYRNRYWEPQGFCQIRDDRIGLMVYDWTITSGGAAKQIQKLLLNSYHQPLAVDGAMGPQTIQALNAVADQNALLTDITRIRKNYYTALAFNADGSQSKNYKFLNGWLNRVDDCLAVQ